MLKILNNILLLFILFIIFNEIVYSQVRNSNSLLGSSIYNLQNNWIDQSKSNFKLEELKGKAVVITMIYTTCKFSCPFTLAFLRKIEKQLDSNTLSNTMFVLVSMDTENDNPEKLKSFLLENELNPLIWKLLTSSEKSIDELASTIGFKFKKISDKDYAHSNIITILNKEGEVKFQIEGLNDENNEFKSNIIKFAK